MPIKQEVTQQLTGQWKVGLLETPCNAPVSFCYGCCCPCCMAGQQRLEILDLIQEPYICCAGLFPCGPCAEPQDRNCAYAEACCCMGMAISGNRFLVQTRFDRMNTFCDDCIMVSVCLASWVVCILKCFCDVPDEVSNCVDCIILTVSGCMLAQQEVEIAHIKKTGYMGMNPNIVGMLPPGQQQMAHHYGKMGPAQQGMVVGGAIMGGAGGMGGFRPGQQQPGQQYRA